VNVRPSEKIRNILEKFFVKVPIKRTVVNSESIVKKSLNTCVSWVACRQLAAYESFQTICEYGPKILFMNTGVWLDKIIKLVIRFLSKIYMYINFYGSW
jgi:hypothetical protein